jgi:flagellar biosynthetic protein FlhB
MSDKDQRTEQPSQQKLKKAREEGRFPVSKELVAGVQFAVFTGLATGMVATWWPALRRTTRELLVLPFRMEVNAVTVQSTMLQYVLPLGIGVCVAGLVMMGASLLTQLGVTGFGLAGTRLTPDLTRLNPLNNLREMPRRNKTAFMEALMMLPVMMVISWMVVAERLNEFLRLPLMGLDAGVRVIGGALSGLLWKAVGIFLLWGAIDLFRQKKRYTDDLKMTKQEVREEYKQNEGSPEIKGKIRRLRRELLKRRMMSEVPKATAIIVNPTHYAVALRYNMQTMAAPKVVAKGKNYLAARIKQKAIENQVPVIENPPLARALYKSVEVGQDIPADLYRAVAEVLAYVFRMMNGGRP